MFDKNLYIADNSDMPLWLLQSDRSLWISERTALHPDSTISARI